jgi:hypothetical protein
MLRKYIPLNEYKGINVNVDRGCYNLVAATEFNGYIYERPKDPITLGNREKGLEIASKIIEILKEDKNV